MIKDILKRFLPPPYRAFCNHMNELLNNINEIKKQIFILNNELSKSADTSKKQISDLENKVNDLTNRLTAQEKIIKNTAVSKLDELQWAFIFNNTITNSIWLQNRTFSPGRWALGYPALYVVYRILNETKPRNILELGLGQSTKMIGQYASHFKSVKHTVVEHDEIWINFFKKDFALPDNSKIQQLDREMTAYKEAEKVRVFKNFKGTFSKEKFDFIFIDAPLGGDMKIYSRIDILSILPDCLMEDFVIFIDDFNRVGEQRTAAEIENILEKYKIEFYKGKYKGEKTCAVICSKSLRFISSL